MARRTIAPALADVAQDIAGEIPLPVVLQWEAGSKTSAVHRSILEDYSIRGTVVCSDSAGLSQLSQQKTLLEVMKLVHDPKEIVYRYGSSIGGKGIGVWAADNTEMFYPDTISASQVIEQMVAAQQEIRQLPVQIGLGIHYGSFIQIGGGLFGTNADFVENLAENYTKGGEIVLTPRAWAKLPHAHKKSATKYFIDELHSAVYRVGEIIVEKMVKKSSDTEYPIPFSHDFFELLCSYDRNEKKAAPVYNRYSQDKIVVLIKIHHTNHRFLLDQFTHWVFANSVVCGLFNEFGLEQIKSNGSLGIFIAQDINTAVACAKAARQKLLSHGYRASGGIAKGEMLIFPLPGGGKEIAGNPVNVASKLAEDVDENGDIWVEESTGYKKGEPFTVQVSQITLRGRRVS